MAAIRSSLIALALLLTGCRGEDRAAERAERPAFDPANVAAAPACRSATFEGSAFTICPFDTSRDRIEMAWRGADGRPLRSLAALRAGLGARAAEVRFAVNGGMYDERGAPIGLYVERGARLKPLNLRSGHGNFHLLPNGVFAVDGEGRVSVTAGEAFARRATAPRFATQSGPMLVIDGRLHPRFDADGASLHIRNGIGTVDERRGFFVISEDAVSFGRFARLFRDALGCADALYLDGSVSSLWDAGAGREDGYDRLGPLILVRRGEAPAD